MANKRRPTPTLLAVATAVIGGALAGAGCHTQADTFYDTLYPCDSEASSQKCGTTRDGRPMTCFPADKLGGTGFCAPACDPNPDGGDQPPPAGFKCTGAGALVQVCDPSAQDVCPPGLSCYRTSLLANTGVCVTAPVCKTDADCPHINTRNVCAGSILRQLMSSDGPANMLNVDGLQCLQSRCSQVDCPPQEFCLGHAFDYGPPFGDLCVPKCSPDSPCPPNFGCQRNLNNNICVPGVPGARCQNDGDCLVGSCVETGVEFKICSLPCGPDADFCSLLNAEGSGDAFLCVQPYGAPSYCATVRPFTGAICANDDDCTQPDQECYLFRAGAPGECQVRCEQDPHCPVRGGLPHVCETHSDSQRSCTPGTFGKRCLNLETPECIPNLHCLRLGTDTTGPEQAGETICTLPCADDSDCGAEPLTGSSAFCGEDKLCRLGGSADMPCTDDRYCRLGYVCIKQKCSRPSAQ